MPRITHFSGIHLTRVDDEQHLQWLAWRDEGLTPYKIARKSRTGYKTVIRWLKAIDAETEAHE